MRYRSRQADASRLERQLGWQVITIRTVLLLACTLAPFTMALAQPPSSVELAGGGGYVFGGGTEDPGPSLPAFDLAITIWPSRHWGAALRWVKAPGDDLHAPVHGYDRTFLGTGNLRYWTLTTQYRNAIGRDFGIEIGVGAQLDARFEDVAVLDDPPLRLRGANESSVGLSVQAMATHPIGRMFGVKAGFTADFNVETNSLHPLVLGVVRF